MKFSSYRLLIVESAVVARGLRALDVPGLEILATGGYVWLPRLEHSSDARPLLNARASPEPKHREFRKALRSKAGLATEIIIATDPDPSGGFIAYCIARFLKYDERLRRGYLSQLSATAVERLIATAVPVKTALSSANKDELRRYFIERQKLESSVLGKLSSAGIPHLTKASAIPLLLAIRRLKDSSAQHFLAVSDPKSRLVYLRSCAPVRLRKNTMFLKIPPATSGPVYPALPRPPSTAFLGNFLPSALRLKSYNALQLELNLLFSVQPEAPASVISYPRTAVRAWTAETWEHLSAALMRTEQRGAEALRPAALRAVHVLKPGTGHQSLHVTDFDQTPHRMRRFLKPPALALYRYLYDATRAALGYPQPMLPECMLQDRHGNIFYAQTAQDAQQLNEKTISIRPIIPLSGLLQFLLDSGWIKASALGHTADMLCTHPTLRFCGAPVPHFRLEAVPDIAL